jgi:hypothetical protein
MTVDELLSLLESLNPPLLPPSVKGASVRYRFEIEDGARWNILLDRGRLRPADQEGSPDCVFQCDRETCVGILSGRNSLLTALVRGDFRLQGDLARAKVLYTFLRYARPLEATA